jgi:hypothetical protein
VGSAEQLFDLLRTLELPLGDYAIFGSGPLLVRGVIEEANDLDVISRGPAWDRAVAVGEIVRLPEDGAEIVSCYGGLVTVGRSWAFGEVDVDDLIDTAEMIAGLPFVRMEHVVEFKRIARRPKDLAHLALLEGFEAPRDGE